MRTRNKLLIGMGGLLLFIIILTIFIYLLDTGYIFISNQTPDISNEMIKNQSKINIKDIMPIDWDFAILVTNKNELDVVEQYKKQGVINKDSKQCLLISELQQLNNILFIYKGENVDSIPYDSRYYEIKTKESGIFYPDDCTFEVKKGIFKTILEQK